MRGRKKKEQDFYQRIVGEFPPATVDIDSDPDQDKPCVSCTHNIRIRVGGDVRNIQCRCEIDWHCIGYCACFEQTCSHYKRKYQRARLKIEVESKVHWKLHPDGRGTCSECGHTFDAVWDLESWQNFCGHCGADMRNGKPEFLEVGE